MASFHAISLAKTCSSYRRRTQQLSNFISIFHPFASEVSALEFRHYEKTLAVFPDDFQQDLFQFFSDHHFGKKNWSSQLERENSAFSRVALVQLLVSPRDETPFKV